MSSPSPSKLHSSRDPSANDVLKANEQISGEDKASGVPSLPLLQLIVMIRKAETQKGKGDSWTPFVNEELKYLRAAVKLLTTDPLINFKYGTSMEGAMSLVGLLKARAATKDIESRIDGVVNDELTPHMAGTKNFKTRNGFKVKQEEADAIPLEEEAH
jgi:hypothetical protein